jgi:geranylgeranyl pyrophosphate synthase
LLIKPEGTQTEALAIEWMALKGKRWRPFLAACAISALDPHRKIPESNIQKLAVAVECFHKASLIHDDIEDDDKIRYGKKTLHAEYGVPVALNAGDLLIGWGYQLLSELDTCADLRSALINIAAHAHRVMCLGQGEELVWSRNPGCLSSGQVLEIFRKKTSPAFDVALTLGPCWQALMIPH